MTDLARPPLTTPGAAPASRPSTTVVRPLPLTAAVVAVLAAGAGLLVCVTFTVGAWLVSGATSTTGAAVRAGVNAWLLAHRAGLVLDGATYTVAPLVLTALVAWLLFRVGRWAGATAPKTEPADVALGVAVMVGAYTVTAEIAAVLASRDNAGASLTQVLLGGAAVGLLAGGTGIVSGAGMTSAILNRLRVPEDIAGAAGRTARSIVGWELVAGLIVTLAVGLLHAGEVAAAFSRLQVGGAEGAVVVLMMLLVLPNAVGWTLGVLFGPGFTVGSGTYVTASAVHLGPVPAFPWFAALPVEGTKPWWVGLLLVVPAVVTIGCVVRDLAARPILNWPAAVVHGALSGALGGLVLGVFQALSSGALGDGRLAHMGPPVLMSVVAAVLTLSLSGAVAALGTSTVHRRWATATEPSAP